MQIRVKGGYEIVTDSHCFQIRIMQKNKKGKLTKKTIGYYATFDSLLEGLVAKKLLRSNATTLTELRHDMDAIRKEIKRIRRILLGKENGK